MKKAIVTLLIILASATATNLLAQAPPPPPSTGHGSTGNQNGGSAPVGSGLFILIGLGAAYGGKKVYGIKTEKRKEEPL